MRAGLTRIGAMMALAACGRFGVANDDDTPAPVPEPLADAGETHDASISVNDANVSDATPPSCTVDFCEDWETDTTSLWMSGGDGQVQRNATRPHGGLYALDSRTASSEGQTRAVFSHRVDTKKRKGTLSAWFWVEEWTGDQPVTVMELGMEPSDGGAARVMVQFTGDASDGDWSYKLVTQHNGSNSDPGDFVIKAKGRTWTKLSLDFDIDKSSMTLTQGEGAEAVSFEVHATTFGDALPIDDLQLRLGVNVVNGGPAAHIYVDDVSLALR